MPSNPNSLDYRTTHTRVGDKEKETEREGERDRQTERDREREVPQPLHLVHAVCLIESYVISFSRPGAEFRLAGLSIRR